MIEPHPHFREKPDPEPCPHCGLPMHYTSPMRLDITGGEGVEHWLGTWLCPGVSKPPNPQRISLRMPVVFDGQGRSLTNFRAMAFQGMEPFVLKYENLSTPDLLRIIWRRIWRKP